MQRQAVVLEKHEEQIARHTAIQSQIAGWQLFVGAVTTGALIYIAYQQYIAAERQVTLEYAKIAPQFAISATLQQTVTGGSVDHAFPRELQVRIRRGEATVESVELIQEIEVSRLLTSNRGVIHHNCIIRVANYFEAKPNSTTEFTLSSAAKRIPLNTIWHQDSNVRDFITLAPENTLVVVNFVDLFDEKRSLKFAGASGRLEQIPSGNFAKSDIYETVDAKMVNLPIQIPKFFELQGSPPKTAGCRSHFGLKGGKKSYIDL